MNSYGYFALSAVVVFVTLAIRRVYRDWEAERKKIAESQKVVPSDYRAHIPMTVAYNPYLKSGDRLTTTVYLAVHAEPGTTEPDITHETQRRAQSEISHWALTFKEQGDAINRKAFSSLKARLAGISGDRYRVTHASVVSVCPLKIKIAEPPKQPLTFVEELMQDVKTANDLIAFEELIASAYPELRANAEIWDAIKNKIDDKRMEILTPVSR